MPLTEPAGRMEPRRVPLSNAAFTENLRSDMSKIYKMIYGVKSDCCYISEIIELECAKNTLIIALIVVEDKRQTKVAIHKTNLS